MLKIAVLDACESSANTIVNLIKKYMGTGTECKICTTPFALASYVYDDMRGDVDVCFVHVNGKHFENIDVSRDIQNMFPTIKLVFYSETTECAEEIFTTSPSGFFLLPIKSDRFNALIRSIMKSCNDVKNQTLHITSQKIHYNIVFSSINYIESDGRKLSIFTNDSVYNVNMTIAEMVEKLPDQFVQCHRSYIVNKEKIRSVVKGSISLFSNEFIPLSRTYSTLIRAGVSN